MQDTVVSTIKFLPRGTPYLDYKEFVVMPGDARQNTPTISANEDDVKVSTEPDFLYVWCSRPERIL